MGLYSTNRFRNLTAEYVEEIMKPVTENEAPDVSDPVSDKVVSEAPEVSDTIEDKVLDESSYIDSLLEALD